MMCAFGGNIEASHWATAIPQHHSIVNLPIPHSWQARLQVAQSHALAARFDACLAECLQISASHQNDPEALLSVGALLLGFGFIAAARDCFMQVNRIAPNDLRPVLNLANVARDGGNHGQSRRLYAALLTQLPNHPVVRRNVLVSLEYDPDVADDERLQQARAWGEWASTRAGGARRRPPLDAVALVGRPLRIGYVSADFCQHTVGWFVKNVITAHDRSRVEVFAYSAGQVNDWITDAIRAASVFHDVAGLDDLALAQQIRDDRIDVLIDLSGHTAGSRLTVFAHRPAPVQVSWLGYFATTGLAAMDAVLLDAWHAPEAMQAQFVEPILRLPGGRLCYVPAPFAPAKVAPPPCLARGHVTFGCFNNTAKFNRGAYATWARIMAAVPGSRLILKWRTFQDAGLCASVLAGFAALGIDAERITLRGASFHVTLLEEYADIDIALDTFPFTGGLTTCEALWMGVPVVTWPQGRAVSRQGLAVLSAIGLPELAGQDADDYVRIAVDLAQDPARLLALRNSLRDRMRASTLCDVPAFTIALEDTLQALVHSVAANPE